MPSVRLDHGWARSMRQIDDLQGKYPEVLFVGTSRTASAIISPAFCEELGVAEHCSLKVTRGGLNFWDAHILFRRYPHLLDHVKVVCLDLMPFQFGAPDWISLPNHFYCYASLAERCSVPARNRTEAVIDFIWPVVSERRTLRQWGEGILKHWGRRTASQNLPPTEENLYWSLHNKDVANDEDQTEIVQRRKENAESWAHGISGWSPSRASQKLLRDLLQTLRKRGIRVILHEPPLHKSVYEVIERNPLLAEAWESYQTHLQSYATDGVDLFRIRSMAELGASDAELLDYGHLGKHAAELYTARFARFLAEAGALKSSSSRER